MAANDNLHTDNLSFPFSRDFFHPHIPLHCKRAGNGIAVFLFAMPLMILELAMGRHFRAMVVKRCGI